MSKLPITLRKLTETDLIECVALIQKTVHRINAKDYSAVLKFARREH